MFESIPGLSCPSTGNCPVAVPRATGLPLASSSLLSYLGRWGGREHVTKLQGSHSTAQGNVTAMY